MQRDTFRVLDSLAGWSACIDTLHTQKVLPSLLGPFPCVFVCIEQNKGIIFGLFLRESPENLPVYIQ